MARACLVRSSRKSCRLRQTDPAPYSSLALWERAGVRVAPESMDRPRMASPKVPLTMRVDVDVLVALRASGQGWQTRVNALLRDAVASGKV